MKCGAYANFTTIEPNKRLQNPFLRFDGIDTVECQNECTLNKKCKSINTNEDELVCELNDKSTEDPRDKVQTVPQGGWTYYSTRYNESLVCRRLFYLASNNFSSNDILPLL